MELAELFRPFALNGLSLPNRIVMAPMTRNRSPGGVPGPDVEVYYRRRAEGGVGLILTEGTAPCRDAQNLPNVPHAFGEPALEGWKKVVAGVHSAGGKIGLQLWHVGAWQLEGDSGRLPVAPVSPSGLVTKDETVGEPMSSDEVNETIDAYARAAAEAQRVGFDAVELHAAHGYLIDQFFWDATNHRTDQYGGDLADRTRFATEIAREIRRRVGAKFPLLLRFSQWKLQDYSARLANTPYELDHFLRPLVSAGIDAFHCSTRRFWEPEFVGSDLNLAGWTKRLSGRPTITVGSIGLNVDFVASLRGIAGPARNEHDARVLHLDQLLRMIARDDFDLVALGRALLADPAWPTKVREGRFGALVPFTPKVLETLA